MNQVLRWVLVLPAALLGFTVAQLATILVGLALPSIVTQELGAFTCPIGFIALGARVAPARKTQVAGLLAILSFLMQGMLLAVIALQYRTTLSPMANLIGVILGVAGTVAGLYVVYLQERRIATMH